MRIIAGAMRGKTIPFDNKKYGNAEVTADRLKEALFSILGEGPAGRSFLDLYSCSGQIGLEALSRGCRPVVFNEIDRRRFLFIKTLTADFEKNAEAEVHNLDAMVCVEQLASRGMAFDYVYLDPPYDKNRGETSRYRPILETIQEQKILSGRGVVIVQHFARNVLPAVMGELVMSDERRYGTNGLVFYSRGDVELFG
ncbi:MAG TPA: hypothetical protein ENN21_04525 [Spirochaetes bacterium]|mgnify:CR=1 FL=1|nr:hypothetical protein [Spirochaetota bacterium]